MINRQFYTMKFKSSRLKQFDYDISVTFDEAKELKEIIALADNQILRSIRDISGHEVDYEKLEEMFVRREHLKKANGDHSDEIKEIQNGINRMMFVPEYITITIDHPKQYAHIYANGILVNGILYRRFSCSSSQARNSTVVLCDVRILDELRRRINNGRDESVPIAPSKFNAYFGLAGSATKIVSEPNFIVVKDFTNQTTFKANYVTETAWDIDDEIDVRDVTLDMNRNDGMGLISPAQAKKWAEELCLDWIPSQWCIRQSFIKGMLCTFDIHDFCKKINGGNYVVDTIYKNESGEYIKADLRNYDVIISESQFKLWNCYKSVDDYIDNYHKNKLYWGISQHTPKEPKDTLTLNYQFIQTLDLNQSSVEKLCEMFVDWVCGVSYENVPYMLLFLLGVNNTDSSIDNFLRSSDQYWIKSLIVNPDIKNDKYITSKIHNFIKYKIKNGCLGSIITDGNFQVLVSDPFAIMEHVCGLTPCGLLAGGEFYSGYWNNKGVTRVDSMRSPMTYRSEHVILDLVKNKDTEHWYKYCQDGIIVNWHGHEMVNWAGADVDFDILATTSNKTMIDSVYKNEIPVVYDPPKPQKIIFTEDDLYNADTFSFGSIIGQITNKGSNGYAMLPLVKNKFGEDSEECKLVVSRLKQCCKAQSCQIDKTKIGREVKGIPDLWVKVQKPKVNSDGEVLSNEAEIKQMEFYNSTLLNKHPYFFKYLYHDSKKKYNQFIGKYSCTCKDKYQMTIESLRALPRKTKEQKEFLDNLYRYMPLTYSDSPMNLVCMYIESVEFNLSKKIKISPSGDIWKLYKNHSVQYTEEQKEKILEVLKKHKQMINSNLSRSYDCRDVRCDNDDGFTEYQDYNDILRDKLNSVCSNVNLIVNCLVDHFYQDNPSANKDMLWYVYGRYIFDNLSFNTDRPCEFPFRDDNGDVLYLGKKYKMKEVSIDGQI